LIILTFVAGLTACATSFAASTPEIPTPPAATTTPAATSTAESLSVPPETATPLPTSTPTPPPTATPLPTPTSTPSLRRLTTGGCCVAPYFSPDGSQVLFLDKPTAAAPVGIYGLTLADPDATPVLVNPTIGYRSPDQAILVTLKGDLANFTNEKTGQRWSVNTSGHRPEFSPDSHQILWTVADTEGPYDRRQSNLWLANLDGSQARLLLSLYGGGLSGWLPDGHRLLLSGRNNPDDDEVTMFIYRLDSGQRVNLFQHKQLRGVGISPGGQWIVYLVTFADNPADNGLWVIKSDGTARRKLDIPGFGAYRWRSDDTLLYIPMRKSTTDSMQLWAIDAATGRSYPLTDPAALPFSGGNGDWAFSPDGRQIIFVSSADQNIWLITLP
jgi:Tol biopolymer transport system component